MVPRGYGSRACICKIGRSHVTSHRGSVGRLLGPVQTVSLVVTLFGGAGCRGRDAEKPVTVGAASGELTAAQVTAARNAGLLPNTPLTPDLIYGSSSLPDSQAYGINNAGQVVGFFHDGGWPFVYGQPAVPFIYSGPTSPPGSPPPTLALLGPSGTGYPSCINDAGYVAGIAGPTAEDWSHAVLWHPDHSVETLPISSLSHATIVTNGRQSPKLAQLFWEAGPRRTQEAFESFLRAEVDAGKLQIPDLHRAASQFFCLLKGELHARLDALSNPLGSPGGTNTFTDDVDYATSLGATVVVSAGNEDLRTVEETFTPCLDCTNNPSTGICDTATNDTRFYRIKNQ